MNNLPVGSPKACISKGRLLCESDGFALPSVLLVVSLLSTLILLLVFAEYFRRGFAYRELAKVKANIAARNGIVWTIANGSTGSSSVPFGDGTKSEVTTWPWGLYRLAVSNGSSGGSNAEYAAFLAKSRDKSFAVALEFSNAHHQLVFAGDARIVGDVHVGLSGATTGTLPGGRSPLHMPVTGKTIRGGEFVKFDFGGIEKQIEEFNAILGTGNNLPKAPDTSSGPPAMMLLDLNSLPENTSSGVDLSGNYKLSGVLVHHGAPLNICIRGTVAFSAGTYIYGAVRILSTGPVVIPADSHIEYGIIYSRSSIEILSSTGSKVQLISPRVTVGKGAYLRYPSGIVSYVFRNDDDKGEVRKITFTEDTGIDGAVMMNGRTVQSDRPELITLSSSSQIVGSVYCEEEMTLDGTVIGTVMTSDFYFYESPTRYYGWMRGGSIVRESLPESYLIPIGFETRNSRLEVLDWI